MSIASEIHAIRTLIELRERTARVYIAADLDAALRAVLLRLEAQKADMERRNWRATP